MAEIGLPILFALILWWVGTLLVLYLDGLPEGTFRWSMIGASALLGLALYGVVATGSQRTVSGALLSFACGVLAWGWQEMSFLTGFLTGPRKLACAAGCRGPRHFLHATQAVLWHELAILAGAAALVALSWDQPNQIGTRTFLLLWGLRQSAKLNLFLGVANPGDEFLPPHLRYLRSYFGRRPLNLLFPFSVTAAAALALGFAADALTAGATSFRVAGDTLLATLAALGAVEHWLLVLPVRASALWQWGLRSHAAPLRAEVPRDSTAPATGPAVVRSA